jgi:hypothetical protein
MILTITCQLKSSRRRDKINVNDGWEASVPASPRTDTADGKEELAIRCRRYIKAEISRREISYAELSRRLAEMGIRESPGSIAMKISRGMFPAWFLVAVMKAIGSESLRLEDV